MLAAVEGDGGGVDTPPTPPAAPTPIGEPPAPLGWAGEDGIDGDEGFVITISVSFEVSVFLMTLLFVAAVAAAVGFCSAAAVAAAAAVDVPNALRRCFSRRTWLWRLANLWDGRRSNWTVRRVLCCSVVWNSVRPLRERETV